MPEAELRDSVVLSAGEREEVCRILRAHVPDYRVWAFGSRVTGEAKAFSDLDLGLDAADALTLAEQAELSEAFQESDLPFRVDLVELALVDAGFATCVRQTGVLLQDYRATSDPSRE